MRIKISKRKKDRTVVERKSVLWFILLRLIIMTSLVVSAVIIQYSTAIFLLIGAFYYMIFFAYFMSCIYLILYSWGKYLAFQVYLQIFFDLLLITALVYISGGFTGSFYFLYIFAIIAASMVLSKRAAYITAAFSCILFGLLMDGMYFEVIPLFGFGAEVKISQGAVINNIFTAWAVFFLVAFFINRIAGKLRRTKAELQLAQKELEVKRSLAVAGEVSANLAHEIRNPLAAISGSIQVLRDKLKLPNEEKKLMDIVVDESRRISQSIEQFLSLASSGRQTFSSIDLAVILRETLMLLERSGELNGDCRPEGNYKSARVPYFGSSSQFKQIFWNLIKNAIKAMPDGGILTVDFIKMNSGETQIRVKDTGKGMTKEEKEKLFQPFYSRFRTGNGIGMSVVQRIVDDYDGEIQVSSELNKGTEIAITLPQAARGIRLNN